MAIYFDRNFNKALRGYNTEEVDSALDAIVLHCEELESANTEFADENNRLIDELEALKTEKEGLLGQLSEMSEKLQRVEETYNTYRQKYGESRDMIVRAQKSSFEIVSEASEKAATTVAEAQSKADAILAELKEKEEALTEEARSEREALIKELDNEISAKTLLSDKLEKDFDEFKKAIGENIAKIMVMLEIRDIERIAPEDILVEDDINAPKKIIPEEISEADAVEEAPSVASDKTEEVAPAESEASEFEITLTDDEFDNGTDIQYVPFDSEPVIEPVFEVPVPDIKEVKTPDTEFSKVKSALDGINSKVKNNKSTPHRN